MLRYIFENDENIATVFLLFICDSFYVTFCDIIYFVLLPIFITYFHYNNCNEVRNRKI